MKLKQIARSLLNRMVEPWGMELAYSHLVVRPASQHDWLQDLNIRTVLDIGANTGQFAAKIRGIIPDSSIYSFEPLGDVHALLLVEMGDDPAFKAFNFALGEENATAEINRSRSSASSSLLRMLELHSAAWPYTAEAGTEKIEVRRLDDVDLPVEPNLLVKIDVQGFEDKVIAGGRSTIGAAACVVTEVSFKRLYEAQPLFDDIYRLLHDMGFEYRGNWDQLPDPRNGELLQADAIFLNRDNLA
jgi:FkbM family methyltransferase